MSWLRITLALGFAVVLVLSGSVRGDFLGVTYQQHTIVNTPAGLRKVYRMYALFTNPGDRLVLWGSAPNTPATTIRAIACSTMSGTNFYNPPNGSTAPVQELIDALPHSQWDSFVTIGVSIADQGSGIKPFGPDVTSLSAGFPPFVPGHTWTSNNAAVYVQAGGAGTEQALAGYAGDGDPELRVLMAQLTVVPEDGLSVRIGQVTWQNEGSAALQTVTDLWLDPLDGQGRCCSPSGQCFFSTLGGCLSGGHNKWLGCDTCSECMPFTPCYADVAGSGNVVNIDDLLLVINNWGAGFGNPADATGDWTVNIDDLLLVINSWGPCP
jgi:hypothetical protein